jgi:cytochrome c oxidase assembly factor CtaG
MSLRTIAVDWSLDGPVGATFLVLVASLAAAYLAAAANGGRRDRRGRRWPIRRTAAFLGGLAVLVVDLYSGIGSEADTRLSVHMVEHMVMWVVVAPLLAAGAPMRLAFFALPGGGRRRLARWLHCRAASTLTRPVVATTIFSGVLLLSHVPAVYGLTLENDYIHEAEHGLYLFTAVLMWASILGVDPLPHRPSRRGEFTCLVGCMVPMATIALWLCVAHDPVYGHYLVTGHTAALGDQRLAAAIMAAASLPAFALPMLARVQIEPRRRPVPPHQLPA